MSLGGTPAAFEDFSLDSRFYSKNPDAIEMLNQKHSSPVLTDKCAKTMPSTFGTPAGLDTQNLENSSDAQTDQEDAGRSISVGAETESIVTHPQGQPQARMDVVIRVDRLGLGVAVSKEYPHPPFFHGYEDNIGELPLFLLQLRRKLAWDKDMFPEPEDQILYAMSRLGETAKSYFAEYMESDGTVRLGSLEEFAEVLSKKYSESEEAVESLKSMIAELESRLKQAESKLKRKETLPKLRIDTWQAFKQYIQNQATFAIQALVGKPKFYWQKSAQEETQPFKTDLEATPSIESWETKWRQGREIPDRIRINSLALLKLLKKVAADDWAMLDLENEETENHSVVFLKPYKFFWYYLDDIRRQKEELYNKFLELEQNPGEYKTVSPKPVQTEDGQAPSSCTKDGALADAQKDRDEMKKSLEGVGWLIRFIENAVMPTATRCRNKDRPPQMITFEELWFLFQPGDVVITRGLNTEDEDYGERSDGRIAAQKTSSEPVAWKVLNSIDGRPRLSPRSGDDARTAPRKQVSHFCLELFKVDFNGASFGPIYRFFNIRYFEGEKDINSLDVVPLWCDKDQDKVKSRLLSIGAKFLDVTKQPYYYQIYNGRKLLHSGNGLECESAMESRENPPKRVNGPVIVDFSTASKDDLRWVSSLGLQQPQSVDTREITEEWPLKVWRVKKADNKNTVNNRQSSEKREQQSYQSTAVDENVYNDLHIDRTLRKKLIAEDLFLSEWEKLNEDDRITADKFEQRFFGDRLLLPDRVCAFVLDNLVFALLTVEGLQDPLQNSQGWNELILPKHGQKVIKTLVKRHRAKNKFMENSRGKPTDDIVAGKGEGLVILLHGAPGLGKTSTVECLRDELQVPLLSLSCGNLGTNADAIEDTLESLLQRAQMWNCLTLLDEADIVLVERDRDNFERSEICSVFLRRLEYYQGILFLTTNRVGEVDEAIKSRIHLAVYYPPLSDESIEEILRNTLRRLASAEKYRDYLEVSTGEIVQIFKRCIRDNEKIRETFNGRVIRNVCQLAVSLAEEELVDKDRIGYGRSCPSVQLEANHVQQALSFHVEFERYMLKARKDTDGERMGDRGVRADS